MCNILLVSGKVREMTHSSLFTLGVLFVCILKVRVGETAQQTRVLGSKPDHPTIQPPGPT